MKIFRTNPHFDWFDGNTVDIGREMSEMAQSRREVFRFRFKMLNLAFVFCGRRFVSK